MISFRFWALAVAAWLFCGLSPATLAAERYVPSIVKPPAIAREFRGVWFATVKNIDWPSKPGLTTDQQKAELVSMLDRAKQLRLNAVLLQVRPSCDALYVSKLEPWSEYLTGQMGRAPAPYYDPLTFAVEEAHKRGLELHAWFNPYRARHSAAISPVSRDHISKTRPQLVKTYGKSLWLDPGEREVQEHSLKVVMDVVQRYDIDGVHFDDYFYPYPEKNSRGGVLPFPDWSSWRRYQQSGGKLERNDWRRENVNLFVVRVSQAIRASKPWVRFGISPFGIWRPGYPAQIKGLDAHNELYADARKWLREGWLDYFAPQLYWAEEKRETSFSALIQWWDSENVHRRHLWPGLNIARVSPTRPATEILSQVRQTRELSGADGHILWGLSALTENRQGLTDALARQAFAQPALTPAYPWVDNKPPPPPTIFASLTGTKELTLRCQPAGAEPLRFWLVQTRSSGVWKADVLPGTQSAKAFVLPNRPEVIAVGTVDRSGNVSPLVVVERRLVPESNVAP